MTANSAAALPVPQHPVTVHSDGTGVDSRSFAGVIISVMTAAAAAAAGSNLLATDPGICLLRRMQAGLSSLPKHAPPCTSAGPTTTTACGPVDPSLSEGPSKLLPPLMMAATSASTF